ncbi:MAG: serine hydrolase domain-containing protein [Acidobacteriota bacterium]|nr:serine hydrolase domain-containing protein [Acidobacteriota bacterium]
MTHVNPESVGLDPARLEVISRILQNEIDNGGIPGAVTLIARKGKIAYHEAIGYKDLETMRPMTTDTIFRIMSISKTITSVAVMKLQEEGRLHIDDPISRYIPEFAKPNVVLDPLGEVEVQPAQKEITIRHLLTHTGGIQYLHTRETPLGSLHVDNRVGDFNIFDYDETIEEYIKRSAAMPLSSEPGEKWVYGWSHDILGYLIEVITGRTVEEYFQEHIFSPLSMVDAHFFLPEEKLDRFPSVYMTSPEGRLQLIEAYDESPFVYGPRKLLSAAGGVICTAEDLARFCQMILNQGKLEGQKIISRKTVESMTANHLGDREIDPSFSFWGQKFGLGFGIRTERGETDDLESLGTLAFSGVYFEKFWIDPKEEMVVIFFIQVEPHDFNYRGIAAKVKNAAFAAIDDDLIPLRFKK